MDLVLDGEAPQAEQADYEQHLELCSPCRTRHQFYSQMKETLRSACSQESCPDLVQARLRKMLQSQVTSPQLSARKLPRVWGLAAAACAALASFALFRPSSERATPLALSLAQDHSRCCGQAPSQSPQPHPMQLAQQTFGSPMPEMARVEGLSPYDVRLCQVLSDHPVVHVLCRDAQQRVFSMYAMPSQRLTDLPCASGKPEIYHARDSRVAAWQHKGWLFSLVAGAAEQELASLIQTCDYECPQQRLVNQPGLPLRVLPASHSSR